MDKKPTYEELELALKGLADMVWESRWVSEEQDYMDSVGCAAAVRSGNIDEAVEHGRKLKY